MKQVEIYTEPEEQNGTKNIHYHRYGNFLNPARFHMDHTGIIGEQNKRLNGKRISDFGWLL